MSPQADVADVPVSNVPCPMVRDEVACSGFLTHAYRINRTQWAVACTECTWWTLVPDPKEKP